MTRPELTARQQEVLDFLRAFIAANGGMAPTHREIGRALGIASNAAVNEHLMQLEAKGCIRRGAGRSRAISVVEGERPKSRGEGDGD